MRGNEGFNFTSSGNADSGTFILRGGKYLVSVIGTSFGTADLKILGPDGSTFLPVITQITANKAVVADLPPGQYKFVNGTITAIAESVTRIPND